MRVAVVTGSAGLIGAETVRFFADKEFKIFGIDNNMRKYFFGEEASTAWSRKELQKTVPQYNHISADIRDTKEINRIFSEIGKHVDIVIHTAAQPSHDWATREPITDFSVNATGTLVLLEAVRTYCPEAVFIFTSTNKV
jgi:CDP-paratose 2-epimerase